MPTNRLVDVRSRWMRAVAVLSLLGCIRMIGGQEIESTNTTKAAEQHPMLHSGRGSIGDSGHLNVGFTVYVTVTEANLVLRNGELELATAPRRIPKWRTLYVASGSYRAVDWRGQPMDPKAVKEKLKARMLVFVWRAENPPMADQLKAAKKGAIILLIEPTRKDDPERTR